VVHKLGRRNDTNGSQDGNLVCSSRPASRITSRSSCSSYADVAAKGLEHDRSSKTPKGVKQRQRRQRKSAVRGTPGDLPIKSTSKSSFC
jgi:hypothetical protein